MGLDWRKAGLLVCCCVFCVWNDAVGQISPQRQPSNETHFIPKGYKIQNVPGDGLCGYWSVLTALKARGKDKTALINVSRSEIFELLKRLSNRINHIIHKEDKTDHEREMIEEIDQLIGAHYASNYDDLCQKVKNGSVQLDSPLAVFLAQEIGCDIIIKWHGSNKSGQPINQEDIYSSGNDAAQSILIFYSGNGSGGHYQSIIPEGMKVNCH